MSEFTSEQELETINQGIADRSNVFYWQTDRAVEPEIAGAIWADRHRYFNDQELIRRVSEVLQGDTLAHIEPLDLTAQTNLGNVNSVRTGTLGSGKEVIIRNHPKGVKNGYFHVEALAAHTAAEHGLPSYETYAVHDFTTADDFAFHVIQKLPGTAIKKWLETHATDEEKLLKNIGATMARMHKIKVEGFGPFLNETAKNGSLVGLHDTYAAAVQAGLAFNTGVLVSNKIISEAQSATIQQLFGSNNRRLQLTKASLVHNDFADWNLLTDGSTVTGILDWDECVAGNPIADIACWSTFFEPSRLEGFLNGYWNETEKPADFEEKFELLRLRYILSKMTLRIRRYSWEPSEFMKEKIEVGKVHLKQSLDYFGV